MKIAITFFTLSFAFSSLANAQPFSDIGTSAGHRVFVPQGSGNQRVGNAVLVRLASINSTTNVSLSQLVLAACDGSWVTSAIQFAAKVDTTPSPEKIFSYGKETEENPPFDYISFESINDSKLYYAKALSRVAPALCKVAAREPRNRLVPVAQSSGEDDIGTSYAIVLGTSTRLNNDVDVWIRSTQFKRIPILDQDGQPLEFEGRVQKKKEETGKSSMARTVFNCKDRTSGVYEYAEYQQQGASPNIDSIPRQKLVLTSVIPHSVGESQLEAVCALYGQH